MWMDLAPERWVWWQGASPARLQREEEISLLHLLKDRATIVDSIVFFLQYDSNSQHIVHAYRRVRTARTGPVLQIFSSEHAQCPGSARIARAISSDPSLLLYGGRRWEHGGWQWERWGQLWRE